MPEYVFRVQNDRGEGPYCASGFYREMGWEHHVDNGRPGPWDDEDVKGHGDRLFGFPTLYHARRWFDQREREQLKAGGFKLYMMEAYAVASSPYQCVFYPAGKSVEVDWNDG